MFEDGLFKRVAIYELKRNYSNRTSKNMMFNSDEPIFTDIKCRIIKDEKIVFDKDMDKLENGYLVEDLNTLIKYEITGKQKAYGKTSLHHIIYSIKRKVI